jgi:hypothetical protein
VGTQGYPSLTILLLNGPLAHGTRRYSASTTHPAPTLGGLVARYTSTELPTIPSLLVVGLQTSRRLRRRPLKVYGPPDVSVVTRCRSTDLPAAPLSPTVGLRTSRRLHRHTSVGLWTSQWLHCHHCRSTDLSAAPSSPSVGLQTSQRLPCRLL